MIIELKQVSKTYSLGKTFVRALKNVNLAVKRGAFMAVTGPSGSGKTTLLNLIGCLDKPDEGSISIDGVDIFKLSTKVLPKIRLEKIGFIFQSFNLVPILTVYENVEYPLIFSNLSGKERRERIFELLEAVGLVNFHRRFPNELSGGEMQRVAVARALVTRPKIVLADEPTGNLDSETGEQIIELMKEMNKKHGATFLFSTHDSEIMKAAVQIVRLHDGEILEGSF
ncbi:MAG: ABC transporter ATP-binding protein [Elusimicrobiota bacterium]|nr:ABC transporter ATP-binding protein [Elusimicrobiota bacterium]MDH5661429.1 ABC transporter ATP-binding protein [Elusimicrobiota bacterium]